jgi:hypothetical protein
VFHNGAVHVSDNVKGVFNAETDPQVRYSTKGPSM